jgi:hypothetical protein
MLAAIAPSVAGWPARKPNSAEANTDTAATPKATLTPLRMCWPTRSLNTLGDPNQLRMG